jgi:fatty acid desaturase
VTDERRKALPQRFVSWADRRHLVSVRTAVIAATVWMTWEVTRWAFEFAMSSPLPGVERAAVIAAVTAPFCALQAAAFGQYMKAKDGQP